MTRRCGSLNPITTPLPCEATKPQKKRLSRKPQTKNVRREMGYRAPQRIAGSPGARVIPFRRLAGRMGLERTEKEKKRELCRKQKLLRNAGVEDRIVNNLDSTTPCGPTAYQNALRTKPNSRAEWTSYCTLRERRRNRAENYGKISPGKLNKIFRQRKMSPERRNSKTIKYSTAVVA